MNQRISLVTNSAAGSLAVFFLLLASLTINRDFASRARAEAAVAESERQLAEIIEHIPNMVYLKDPRELRFIRFNKAGELTLG